VATSLLFSTIRFAFSQTSLGILRSQDELLWILDYRESNLLVEMARFEVKVDAFHEPNACRILLRRNQPIIPSPNP
jgi:hypothetical protein